MCALQISPIPITDIRLAIYCASLIDAFDSVRRTPTLQFETIQKKVLFLRKLNRHMGDFESDNVLDEPCPDLVTSVLKAVSVRVGSAAARSDPAGTVDVDAPRASRRAASSITADGVATGPSTQQLAKLRTPSATVGRALVVLSAERGQADASSDLEDCDSVDELFARFAEVRRSWNGDGGLDIGGGHVLDDRSVDEPLGWSVEDGGDG